MAQRKNGNVPKGKNLKQLILECSREHGWERVGEREIRAIGAELRGGTGNGHKVSPSYIANVLREAGARVEVNDPFVDPSMEEPYASRLAGLLKFGDLEEAESSLRKLDTIFQDYRSASDREGTSLVRTLVSKGKQRAEILAASLLCVAMAVMLDILLVSLRKVVRENQVFREFAEARTPMTKEPEPF